MPVRLTVVLEDIEEAVTDPEVQRKAADAMEKAMESGVRRSLHGNLHPRNWRGAPIALEAVYTAGSGEVRLPLKGGTYALMDKGRRRKRRRLKPKARKRKGQRRPTLSTPWGPRVSVRGSRSRGLHLTDTHGPAAVGKATEAAVTEAVRRFAKAV